MRSRLFLPGFLLLAQFLSAQTYYVRFPNDTLIANYCHGLDPAYTGRPEFYNPGGLPLVATYEDEVPAIIVPACLQVERRWLVYNDSTYDPAIIAVPVPNPSPVHAIASNFGNPGLLGPTVSPIDTPGDPWSATVIFLHPSQPEATHFSTFWDSTANAYRYIQVILIMDSIPPDIISFPQDPVQVTDTTSNDPLFWNEASWTLPGIPGHDLTEAPVELTVTAFDSCWGNSLYASFLLFLDLDQDSVEETVVRSYDPPGMVRYNNINTPNYNGGTLRPFDNRPVSTNEKYIFDAERTVVNDQSVSTLRWRKYSWPWQYEPVQLPPGRHHIEWEVQDGCGSSVPVEYALHLAPPPVEGNSGFKNVYIHFPDDLVLTDCSATAAYGEPDVYNPDGADIHFSYEDQPIGDVPDACYKIERSWKLWNADTCDPALPCTAVPNPAPFALFNNPDNLPGPIVSPAGAAAPWEPTVVKITVTDPDPTDFSTYWTDTANCYQYDQVVRIIDLGPPLALDCPATDFEIQDLSSNDPQLWNAPYWSGSQSSGDDLKEAAVDLHLTATDSCSGANVLLSYLLLMDLDGDDIMESAISSLNPPPPGMVRFNNINTPNYEGGELRQFDQRGLPAEQSYQFALQNTSSGLEKTAAVRWNTQAAPTTYVEPQLPPGLYRIRWSMTDGCGNGSVCEPFFHIVSPVSGTGAPAEAAGPWLFPPAPNPFDEATILRFRLPEAAPVRLSVLDATGRLLWDDFGDRRAGEQQLTLKKNQLGAASGLLVCRLEYQGRVLLQKMVLK